MKNLFKIKTLAILSLIAFLGFTSCNDDETVVPVTPPVDNTIAGKAVATADLSILVAALTKTNLVATLQGAGPFTVFAPNNAAFGKLNISVATINASTQPQLDALKQILLNHVIAGSKTSTQLTDASYLKTSATGGATATNTLSMYVSKNVTATSTTVKLNGVSNVLTPNVVASNGIIHIVDTVIELPTIVTHAVANPDFENLVAALTRTGNTTNFASILGGTASSPFTVFAPVDPAFTSFLAELNFANLAAVPEPALDKILKYHVITGANVLSTALPMALTNQNTFLGQIFQIGTTGGAKIVDISGRTCNIGVTDVQCSNGVIHVLDRVLKPNLAP